LLRCHDPSALFSAITELAAAVLVAAARAGRELALRVPPEQAATPLDAAVTAPPSAADSGEGMDAALYSRAAAFGDKLLVRRHHGVLHDFCGGIV